MDEGQFRLYQIERIMTINAASHTWPSKPTPEDAEEALEAAMLEVEKEKGQVLGGSAKKTVHHHTHKKHTFFSYSLCQQPWFIEEAWRSLCSLRFELEVLDEEPLRSLSVVPESVKVRGAIGVWNVVYESVLAKGALETEVK